MTTTAPAPSRTRTVLHRLAALLHSGQSGDYRGMPPGGIAVLSLPAEASIEPGIAQLSAFWWP